MILLFAVLLIFDVFQKVYKFLLMVFISAFIFSSAAHSEFIAQINVMQAGVVDRIYIKLLENDAPLTVQNFRNYVRDGDYNNSFIHRGMPGFILQGGGFVFDDTLNDGSFSYDAVNAVFTGGLQLVSTDLSVINEFKNSNLRGTLAMAKLGSDPNSATSQWFVNLVDNSTNLDNQNGGFTVFAEVLDGGMDVFDAIAGLNVYDRSDIHFAFTDLPLLNYQVNGQVMQKNLVFINSVDEILSITPDINYGVVTAGSNVQPEIVIENTGVNPVVVGDIGGVDALADPFKIVSDLCSNKTLAPRQRCSFIVLFSPTATGVYEDSLDAAFPDMGINYSIRLSGEGASSVDEPDITSSYSSVDFAELDVLYRQDIPPYSKKVLINNFGALPLKLNGITLSTGSAPEFSLAGDCLQLDVLAASEFCLLDILYRPLDTGHQSATIIIESNDPDENPFEIPVFAASLGESDGVEAAIENAAPNNGDGNNDGILDSQQSYIASLPDVNGTYLTYISDSAQQFMDVRIVDQETFTVNRNDVASSTGVHEFTVDNVPPDGIVGIGLLLPAAVDLSSYYIFGETLDNPTPHWYAFDFDGETGATFLGVAKFTSPIGSVIDKSIVLLKLKNGGRGDSTATQDNKLTVRGGISYNYRDTSSGSLSFYFPPVIFIALLFRKRIIYENSSLSDFFEFSSVYFTHQNCINMSVCVLLAMPLILITLNYLA